MQHLRLNAGRFYKFCFDALVHPRSPAKHLQVPLGIHLERDLRLFLGASPENIVDVGAHHGSTVRRFAKHFPRATVHAFEPIDETFERLSAMTRGLGNVHLNHAACGVVEGPVTIEVSLDSERNSLKPQLFPSGKKLTVNVRRLDNYAIEHMVTCIDVLKIDAEGFEIEVLRGAGYLLDNGLIKAVYAECGFVPGDTDKTFFPLLDEFLRGYGFRFSGFYDHFRWGKDKRCAGFSNGLWLIEN